MGPAVRGLMLLCVMVFVVTFTRSLVDGSDRVGVVLASLWNSVGSAELLRDMGALDLTRVWIEGEWWRVLTTAFVHGSWLHLALNMLALASVGPWAERTWGTPHTLLLFVASSLGGCLASVLWCEGPLVIGASAGIMGVAGALYVARRFGGLEVKSALAPLASRSLALWVGLTLAVGAMLPVIAQAGHVGGLTFGVLGGWALGGRSVAQRGAGWSAVAGGIVSLALAGEAPTWHGRYHQLLGYRHLEAGNLDAAVQAFSRAESRLPGDPEAANDLAYSLAETGRDLERAERVARYALSSDPDDPSFLDTLGWILCRRNVVEEGRALLEQALRGSDPRRHEIYEEICGHLERCSVAARTCRAEVASPSSRP
jgi:membrane associated rhomboid family serine protease